MAADGSPGVAELEDGPAEAPTNFRKVRVRGRTISIKRLSKRELLRGTLENPDLDIVRPEVRDDCIQGAHAERPCPYVSCKYHLFLDVSPRSGAIKLNFPDLEVWELSETCALDVADRGGVTLDDVGAIMNLTRERIRQLETRGVAKLKALNQMAALAEHLDESGPPRKWRPSEDASYPNLGMASLTEAANRTTEQVRARLAPNVVRIDPASRGLTPAPPRPVVPDAPDPTRHEKRNVWSADYALDNEALPVTVHGSEAESEREPDQRTLARRRTAQARQFNAYMGPTPHETHSPRRGEVRVWSEQVPGMEALEPQPAVPLLGAVPVPAPEPEPVAEEPAPVEAKVETMAEPENEVSEADEAPTEPNRTAVMIRRRTPSGGETSFHTVRPGLGTPPRDAETIKADGEWLARLEAKAGNISRLSAASGVEHTLLYKVRQGKQGFHESVRALLVAVEPRLVPLPPGRVRSAPGVAGTARAVTRRISAELVPPVAPEPSPPVPVVAREPDPSPPQPDTLAVPRALVSKLYQFARAACHTELALELGDALAR
jgi:hypothetical protein